jgi:hypothetical protein
MIPTGLAHVSKGGSTCIQNAGPVSTEPGSSAQEGGGQLVQDTGPGGTEPGTSLKGGLYRTFVQEAWK